jgi:N-acetylneuraminic acid mutarotase
MLARRSYPQSVLLEGRIFVIGGSADGRTLNTVEVFDPEQNAWAYWFTMPPMNSKRTLHGAAVSGGRLFVCGGFDGIRDMNSVECYESRFNAWKTKNTWNVSPGRSYFAFCPCGNNIYAIGGQDRRREEGPRAHEHVEAFDLYSERWLPVANLQTGRLGLTASHLVHTDGADYVYACGGSDGSDVLRTVERYNVKENTWSAAPPMSRPRLGHAAAVVNNKLYVIGGYDGKEPLNTFECFDPKTDSWGPVLTMGGSSSLEASVQIDATP